MSHEKPPMDHEAEEEEEFGGQIFRSEQFNEAAQRYFSYLKQHLESEHSKLRVALAPDEEDPLIQRFVFTHVDLPGITWLFKLYPSQMARTLGQSVGEQDRLLSYSAEHTATTAREYFAEMMKKP